MEAKPVPKVFRYALADGLSFRRVMRHIANHDRGDRWVRGHHRGRERDEVNRVLLSLESPDPEQDWAVREGAEAAPSCLVGRGENAWTSTGFGMSVRCASWVPIVRIRIALKAERTTTRRTYLPRGAAVETTR